MSFLIISLRSIFCRSRVTFSPIFSIFGSCVSAAVVVVSSAVSEVVTVVVVVVVSGASVSVSEAVVTVWDVF